MMLNPDLTITNADLNIQPSENAQINQKYFDKDRFEEDVLGD
jgi:hypothetical protein